MSINSIKTESNRIEDTNNERNLQAVIAQVGPYIPGKGENVKFGESIDLSREGRMMVCGGPGNDASGRYKGQVRTYSFDVGNWTQIGQELTGERVGDNFGYSVGISGSGRVIAVGSRAFDLAGYDSGRVTLYQYHENHEMWEQIGNEIVGDQQWGAFGKSLSLSKDGYIVAVGAPGDSANGFVAGKTEVFYFDGDFWLPLGSPLYGNDRWEYFGTDVALSDGGYILAVGAPGAKSDTGEVRVFEWGGLNWEDAGIIVGEKEGSSCGSSVSMSGLGNAILVGCQGADGPGIDSGSATVYKSTKAHPDNDDSDDGSTDYSPDYSEDSSAYSYSEDRRTATLFFDDVFGYAGYDDDWSAVPYSDGEEEEEENHNIDYSEDYSADYSEDYSDDYSEDYSEDEEEVVGDWEQIGNTVRGQSGFDRFGAAVSMSHDGLSFAVGAPTVAGDGYMSLFRIFSGPEWRQVAKVTGEDYGEGFGTSVGITEDGKFVGVGSPRSDYNGDGSGKVTMYKVRRYDFPFSFPDLFSILTNTLTLNIIIPCFSTSLRIMWTKLKNVVAKTA